MNYVKEIDVGFLRSWKELSPKPVDVSFMIARGCTKKKKIVVTLGTCITASKYQKSENLLCNQTKHENICELNWLN